MSSLVKQVVIFCGGLGSRLGDLTKQIPKPIIPVAGKPYLEWQIESLRAHGLTDFKLLTGYLAEQIEDYFGDGRRWQVKISYSREPKPLGTTAALKRAEPGLCQRFLLMNGDTFFPMDYTQFLRKADAEADKVWLVAVPARVLGSDTRRGNTALDEASGRVTEYVRGGRDDLDFVHAGMFALDRSWLAQMQGEEGVSVESALCPSLIERDLLRAFVVRERFYDMGTPKQLRELDEFLTSYRRKLK
ncbi:MAG: hypothetical protein EXS18_00190 [Verrucomicrobiae bacterium]|nr:hypothetical protein [Verrucomicrobiae bacterium]